MNWKEILYIVVIALIVLKFSGIFDITTLFSVGSPGVSSQVYSAGGSGGGFG